MSEDTVRKKPEQDEKSMRPTGVPTGKDGKVRSYYYDDAHGYENFVDTDEEEDPSECDDPTSSDAR